MEFNEQYYVDVWGTVHRHDYCPYWADRLVRENGKCRILDLGTGCGHLVKLLREKGCEAWGVDSGEYAIANSCAPGYILKSSVTDLPFRDDSFDVVFSNGLWEYLTLEEIAAGAKEIWRVGARQVHHIDHDKTDFREDFVTWKPLWWWDAQLAAPKVLISCPTHQAKEYAHKAWLDAVKAIDWPNFEIFVVDNSPTPDCAQRWGFEWLGDYTGGAVDPKLDMAQRMAACMEIARQKFLSEGFALWFNIEIDIIVEPEMLKTLLRYGRGCDWIAHTYPPRGGGRIECNSGVGCSIWSRRLIEDFLFTGSGDHAGRGVDAFFWQWFLAEKKYKCVEYWCCTPIQHLKEPEGVAYPI